MMFQDKSRERRSDRLMFTIALRVEGITEQGEAFECPGRATGVNRYGAQIRLDKSVTVGHQVRITNLYNKASGDFRVVGMLASSSPDKAEFGVEALGDYPAFWGIDFPPRPRKPSESRALLECRDCHTVRFLPLSFSEVDVLESGGVLLKACAICSAGTPWGYARQAAGPEELAPGAVLTPAEEQGDRPAFVQRPISLRSSSGKIDHAQTESLSKRELSVSSERTYEVNQEVTLEWANPGTGLRVEARGRVLRRHDIGGSRRKIYNIRYESPITALPTAQPAGTRKYYLAFGALLAAAAVLVETNVQALTSNVIIRANDANRFGYLAGVLLLVCLAYKVWKSILAHEPEARKTQQRKHRITAVLAAVVFTGALAFGITRGWYQGGERVHAQILLRDLAISGTFEANVDASENRAFTSPSDYLDACATLQLLAERWEAQLGSLTVDAAALTRSKWPRGERFERAMQSLAEVINLNRQKIELVQKQVNLRIQAQGIPRDKQADFWQANFQNLRQQIRDLDARKGRLLSVRMAQN
jgi:hypothetical protein